MRSVQRYTHGNGRKKKVEIENEGKTISGNYIKGNTKTKPNVCVCVSNENRTRNKHVKKCASNQRKNKKQQKHQHQRKKQKLNRQCTMQREGSA